MSSDHEAAIAEGAPAKGDAATQPALLLVRHAWSGMAHVVLLALLVAVLHSLHLLDVTEGYSRRVANAIHLGWEIDGHTVERRENLAGSIHILEISAYLRASKLEIRDKQVEELKEVIGRLRGIRPIDRCELAKLLKSLARGWPEASATTPRVVAIDIDLAPLNQADAARCYDKSEPSADTMEAALTALSTKALVLAVAMDRDNPEDRRVRNDFMRRTCSQIRYASPRIFHGFHDYPLDFPDKPNRHATDRSKYVFPSLGNLIRLAAWPQAAKDAASEEERDEREKAEAEGLLCEQVNAPGPGDSMILEDRIEPKNQAEGPCPLGQTAADCERFDIKAFDTSPFNWRWLDPDFVLTHTVTRLDGFECSEVDCIQADALNARVLLLSVDGGAQDDKFDVPQAAPDPVSGATLHALQAMSLRDESMVLHLHSMITVAVDLATGFCFLLFWEASKAWIEHFDAASSRRFILWLLVPLGIAAILYTASVRLFSPWLLNYNVWANPAYILLGLVLHAYVEVGHSNHGAHGEAEAPDFSFGLRRWLDAGARPHPASASEWCDATLSAVLQWLVILFALTPIVLFGEYGWQGRVFAAIIVVVAMVLVARQRLRGWT